MPPVLRSLPPISIGFRRSMDEMVRHCDGVLNYGKTGNDRPNGVIIISFPMSGHDGLCNIQTNGLPRDAVIDMLERTVRRLKEKGQ